MIVSNLSKTIDGKDLIDGISFVVNDGNKIGLVGKNGVGKSTLLKIISGILNADSGKINLNGQSIKLLKQEIDKNDYDYSILDYIKKETNILFLEKRLHELENNLTDENMEEYGEVLDEFLRVDGYNFETNLEIILRGLNLNIDTNKPVRTLSGGQKIKLLLASLLLSNADILLLDEPTNNLDIEAVRWLENYLIQSDKKMIIVSHDEEFLNNVTNKIFELGNGKLVEYNLNYTDYLSYKDLEYTHKLEKYERAQEQKRKLKAQVQEAKEWANKGLSSKKKDNDKIAANFSKERTKKTASRASKLTRELEKIDIDTSFRKHEPINFTASYSGVEGNGDIYVDNLVCGYDKAITPPIKIDIPFGSRVQINGSNGSGKTTFIKTLLEDIEPISGKVIIGNGVKIGYISQDSLEADEVECSIYDYLTKDSDIDKSMLFNILTKFHISYDDRDKLYISLSPGQRTKVNLAKLAINKINTLILDEATNHLDLEAIKVLEEVIDSFDGTIISISHNRAFNKHLNPNMILDIKTGILTYQDEYSKKKG